MTKSLRFCHIMMWAFLLTLAAGCTHEKVYKIGISQCSSDDWRAKMNSEIEREVMLHDDVRVERHIFFWEKIN